MNNETTNLTEPLPPAKEAAGEAPAPAKPLRLSEEIAGLIEAFAERSVTLRKVVDVLQGRAYTLLVILLALPFCTPILLPGFSTGFDAVVPIKETLSGALTDLSAPCD